MAFASVTAQFFRLTFTTLEPPKSMLGDIDLSDLGIWARLRRPRIHISNSNAPRVHGSIALRKRPGFAIRRIFIRSPLHPWPRAKAIQKSTVV